MPVDRYIGRDHVPSRLRRMPPVFVRAGPGIRRGSWFDGGHGSEDFPVTRRKPYNRETSRRQML
jgi:hypothetical protein